MALGFFRLFETAVNLSDNAGSSYNELYQSFSADVTQIKFNIAAAGINPAAADSFNVALLDGSSGFPQLTTTDPLGVSLITLSISDQISVNAYASASSGPGFTASITAVPLPAGGYLFASALAAVASWRRKSS